MGNHIWNFKTSKKILLGFIVSIGLLVMFILTYSIILKENHVGAKSSDNNIIKKENKKKNREEAKIKVDVKGAVNAPGVYELDNGSRVIDAINIAGGLTEQANTSIINLSKVLEDGYVIVIYTDNDLQDVVMDKYVANNYACPSTINDACIVEEENLSSKTTKSSSSKAKSSTSKISSTSSSSSKTTGIVNINTASLEELQTIPGVGEAKAQAIITYREENGGFKSIEEITNVSGIGESTFEKIKTNITI